MSDKIVLQIIESRGISLQKFMIKIKVKNRDTSTLQTFKTKKKPMALGTNNF